MACFFTPKYASVTPKRPFTTLKSLPFRVTRSEAQKMFSNEMTNSATSKKLEECFVPFHSVDLDNVITSYECEYKRDRIEYYATSENGLDNPTTRSKTVTEWHRIVGTLKPIAYPFGTKWS